MDYEKKYNEALEKARKRVATEPQDHTDAILKDIFPELRESEDERIRKELVAFFKGMQDSDWHDLEIDHILAWLEKQKEQKPEWSEMDELMMKAVIGILDERDHPKLCHWLKFLRPSWKPSEEQMKVFDGLYHNYILDKKDYKVLESLYEQLKKL